MTVPAPPRLGRGFEKSLRRAIQSAHREAARHTADVPEMSEDLPVSEASALAGTLRRAALEKARHRLRIALTRRF